MSHVDALDIAALADPALYEGGIPKRISSLASDDDYQAAFDQSPIGGALSHRIADEGVWVGAQGAAGVLPAFEDTPVERARILAELRAHRISVIVCCCFADDDPHTRVFANDSIAYVCALLSDGAPSEMAACVLAFVALVERAWPLVHAAVQRGDSVLVHCNSGMHRSASVAMALLMMLRGLEGAAGLARVFADAVQRRVVMRPTFWPVLESPQFAALARRLRASIGSDAYPVVTGASTTVASASASASESTFAPAPASASASASDKLHVHVQNMAGAILDVEVDGGGTTVAALKALVHARNADASVARQTLFIEAEDVNSAHTVLADERTLASYGIVDATTVHMFIAAHAPGTFLRVFHRNASGAAGYMRAPNSICASPSHDEIFIADFKGDCVQVFRAADGAHVRTLCGGDDSILDGPCQMHATSDGSLFVADFNNNEVHVLHASSGELLRLYTGGVDMGFKSPSGVCVDETNDTLYVADADNHRVQVLRASDGAFLRTIGGNFNLDNPEAVCICTVTGTLVVADRDQDRVQVFRAADGALLRTLGAGELHKPVGMCLSPQHDLLFVASTFEHTVRVYRLEDGECVRTIGAGLGGDGDGEFRQPYGVCVVGDELLVVEWEGRVQSFAM